MTIFQALILGVIQGLTEFLPISSSAHLVVFPFLMGWNLSATEAFIFDVLVQIGTLVAVILYFWKDLWQIGSAIIKGLFSRKKLQTGESRLGWLILLATLPAGIFGLLLKEQVEAAFDNPVASSIFLVITALLLSLAEWSGKRSRDLQNMGWKDSIWIGLFQALAIFPGISRSGSTIAGAMFRNLQRPPAARFSFLMSIPIMLAAGGVAVIDLAALPTLTQYVPIILTGFCTAAIVGYLAIRWFIRYLSNHSLYGFAGYCLLLSAAVLLMRFLR